METKMRGAHLPAKNVTYDVATNRRTTAIFYRPDTSGNKSARCTRGAS